MVNVHADLHNLSATNAAREHYYSWLARYGLSDTDENLARYIIASGNYDPIVPAATLQAFVLAMSAWREQTSNQQLKRLITLLTRG